MDVFDMRINIVLYIAIEQRDVAEQWSKTVGRVLRTDQQN